MRLVRRFQGCEIEALIGRRSIAAARSAIEDYRDSQCLQGRELHSLRWFLGKRPVWRELPVVLLSRREGALEGVVLLYYSTAFGVPYGLVRGGRRGDACLIAPRARHRELAELAASFLLQHLLAHTVILSVPGQVAGGVRFGSRWLHRSDPYRLDLAGGFEATMQRLSYKLRRNLRYYRRRAAAGGGCHFDAEMTPEQRRDAVAALCEKGRYPTGQVRARRWDRALQDMPGGFAMGLQGERGNWVSYVAGWREPGATYLDWQLNDESASAATVMRAHLIEHEIQRGSPALVFVGGTSPIWQRACKPAVSSDLVALGMGPLARFLRGAYMRLLPNANVTLLCRGVETGRVGPRAPNDERVPIAPPTV